MKCVTILIAMCVCVCVIPGGTDIISCFAGQNPSLPVYRGEIQGRNLGMAMECWNCEGQEALRSWHTWLFGVSVVMATLLPACHMTCSACYLLDLCRKARVRREWRVGVHQAVSVHAHPFLG